MPTTPREGLTYKKPTVWSDVYAIWQTDEAKNPNWIKLFTERGFESWEAWRGTTIIAPLRLPERTWHLYTITDPTKTVPTFHGGPFRSWQERYYDGKISPSFAEIVRHPDMAKHSHIQQMSQSFYPETTIIGIESDQGIIIAEGMHRAAAIAFAALEGRMIQSNVTLALGSALPPGLTP